MLAVFNKAVAPAPADLANLDPASTCRGEDTLHKFGENFRTCVKVRCGEECAMAYSMDCKENSTNVSDLYSKVQFAASGEVFCIFIGQLENQQQLSHIYGIKNCTEAQLAIRAYRLLSEQGQKSLDRVVQDFQGEFSVCLYDNVNKKVLIARDNFEGQPLYWGTCQAGHMLVSDSSAVLKGECGKSFAPFPKGCYFTTSIGLHSFTHPTGHFQAIPHVDSKGEVCGSAFRVESEQDLTKKDLPRSSGIFLGSF